VLCEPGLAILLESSVRFFPDCATAQIEEDVGWLFHPQNQRGLQGYGSAICPSRSKINLGEFSAPTAPGYRTHTGAGMKNQVRELRVCLYEH